MTQSDQIRQIRWRCHRGMLELDVILINFFDANFTSLPDMEQTLFVELLQEQDPTLWDWFLQPEQTEQRFMALVRKIIDKTQTDAQCCPSH